MQPVHNTLNLNLWLIGSDETWQHLTRVESDTMRRNPANRNRNRSDNMATESCNLGILATKNHANENLYPTTTSHHSRVISTIEEIQIRQVPVTEKPTNLTGVASPLLPDLCF